MQGLVLWGDAGLDAKTSRNPLMGYKAQERTELGDHVGSVLDKVTQQVKNLPEMQETQVQSLGREDLLGKEMATHSGILAWKIPSQRSLVGCNSWHCKESGTTERLTLQ